METATANCWGVILAGGEGRRLRDFTKSLYGYPKPKQFCVFSGTRSMLEHTVDRASILIPTSRILAVIRRDHLRYTGGQLHSFAPTNLIVFPHGRETAPSILYSLLHVVRHDPNAIVAIFPSDHCIIEEEQFIGYVRRAYSFVRRNPDDLVLLGAEASYPETEYGWIEPGHPVDWDPEPAVSRVKRFWEKPGEDVAKVLFSKGCLWNTLVTVGTVGRYLDLFRAYLPDLYERFREVLPSLGSPGEREAVERAFRESPSVSFSADLLGEVAHTLTVLRIEGIHWSDWGDRDRIAESLTSAPQEWGRRWSDRSN